MRVFVTGAKGFVAGHLVETLCAAGHAVPALVQRPADETWVSGAEQVEEDIARDARLRSAVQDAMPSSTARPCLVNTSRPKPGSRSTYAAST